MPNEPHVPGLEDYDHDLWGYQGGDGSLGGEAGEQGRNEQRAKRRTGILQPPPLPPGMSRGAMEQHVLLGQQVLIQALLHPYTRQLLADTLSWVTQAKIAPTHQPPWIEFPFRGQWFGDATSDASVEAAANDAIVSGTIPEGRWGVIKTFAQDVANPDDWDNLTWSITIDDVPVPGFSGFLYQLGQIEAPWHTTIIIPPLSTWALKASNGSGSAIADVVGRVHGWSWPVTKRGDSGHDHSTAV